MDNYNLNYCISPRQVELLKKHEFGLGTTYNVDQNVILNIKHAIKL